MNTQDGMMNTPSPEQARQQLGEAATRAKPSRRDAAIGAAVTGGLSLIIAATLTAVTFWRGNPVALATSMGIYALSIALLMWWLSRRRVTDRGWARRYLWGFGSTMVLYSVGIVWQSLAFPGWAIFAPFCLLVAVPGVVAAGKMLKA